MSHASTAKYDIILPIEPADDTPTVRSISASDLYSVFTKAWADFKAMPTHALFIGVIYPVVGLILGRAALGYEFIPLIYPLASGFALLGPFAAIGLYELSRRREMERDTSWRHIVDFIYLPTAGSIATLGGLLLVIFLVWVATADALYVSYFGHRNVTSLAGFLENIAGTPQGWSLALVGNLTGLAFAAFVFALTVITIPLLLDRHVSLAVAMATSLKATLQNPVPMAVFAFVVAVGLFIGSLPLLMGLVIVFPVLGHATWHLYKAVIEPDTSPRPDYRPRTKYKRYGAQFPASLFVSSSFKDED